MRVAVLGGTRFIGRAILRALVERGHDVVVVHRGTTEPDDLPPVAHVHADRRQIAGAWPNIEAFGPDALIDTCAFTREHAESTLAVAPPGIRLAVLSSMDVYEAYAALLAGRATEPVPIDETGRLRRTRYPLAGRMPGGDDYDKLDVEEPYLDRGAAVLRLPMVYGEHDPQRREWPVLRRIVAGRIRIPCGPGTWLWSRGYADDCATATCLAVEIHAAAGETFNVCEAKTLTVRQWHERIAAAADAAAEFVEVPAELVPEDLGTTATTAQHLLMDPSKARRILGWTQTDPDDALARSVRWHLDHPPDGEEPVFAADDEALAASNA